MEIKSFKELTDRVESSGKCFRVAVASAGDSHTLEAAMAAKRKGVISPILVGDADVIKNVLASLNETVPDADIVHVPDPAEAAAKAVALINENKADLLMKGKLDTALLLRAALNAQTGLGTGRLMSTFLLAEIPGYHKLVAVIDGAMIPYPTLEQKKGIIENAVGIFRDIGYDCPKVALLACIEKVNPKMPETVEADALKQMNLAGEIKNCIVEGPVSYDCAMDPESAKQKNYVSPVTGNCDILVAPNIHAANIMAKMLMVHTHTITAGFITGAKCPIVMSSRGSSPEEKLMSIELAVAAVLGKK